MPARKSSTAAICAAVLTLGLAACGGGGGGGDGSGSTPESAPKPGAVVLSAAIQAAGTTGAGGTFDDRAHGVAPTVTATNDGTKVTVTVTETGTPRGGTMRGGEFVVDENGPAPITGWAGARFRRGTAMEQLVVHANVGAPEVMPFTPEYLNRLSEVSGLTGEMVPAPGLTIEAAYWPVIRSTSLQAAPSRGSVTYGTTGTGTDEGLSFMGSFSGGPGEYTCSGSACSVTLDDGGVPTAMGGAWMFAPGSGAMVHIPDYDYLYFGWWLDASDEEAYGFQTFADAAGFSAGAGDVAAAMEGSATYRGAATGVWATVDSSGGRVTSARSGDFTAEAVLTANFFGALDPGAVNGEIRSFRDGSGRRLGGWQVTLNAAKLTTGWASFAGETVGQVGPGSSGTGSWEGRFHGTDGAKTNARPSHVTGRFDLHFPGARLAGAFGARK